MNVEIVEGAQFPFWEYFFPIFGTVSLQSILVSQKMYNTEHNPWASAL